VDTHSIRLDLSLASLGCSIGLLALLGNGSLGVLMACGVLVALLLDMAWNTAELAGCVGLDCIKVHSQIKGSRDRAALGKSKVVKHVQDISVLTQVQSAIGTIANDLHTKLEGCWPQVMEFEVLSKLLFELLDLVLGFGCKSDVIHKDRQNDFDTILLPDED
jgi:hypothetical protein